VRHSVFTIEVCARVDASPRLQDELLPIVQNAPEQLSRDEAWERHANAAESILRYFDSVERGCWEYFDDETLAKAMFDEWCRPVLEQDVPRQGPSGGASYRDEAGPRYMTFTLVYLLAYGSPSDLEVRATCDIPERALWKRDSFRRLLGAVRMLSFASVKGDSMYLIPRDRSWALTELDLEGPNFQYLRKLEP
jgi:hypothetical protein